MKFQPVAVDGFASFQLQTGAPQQAASAAWSSFQIITVYVVARALDERETLQRNVDATGEQRPWSRYVDEVERLVDG